MGREQRQSAGRHGELFWTEEKDNFGLKMMKQMGWEQGKGLGKNNDGVTKFIRAKKKRDNSGIGGGATTRDDTWCASQGLFNELLTRLNAGNEDRKYDGEVEKEEEAPVSSSSARLKAYMTKRRLYGRFKKSKDLGTYSKTDLSAVLGKKASAAPTGKPNEVKAISQSSIDTITSKTSMADYFKKKLADKTKEVTQFQAASGGGFSLDQQTQIYEQAKAMSMTGGKRGLGFGGGGAGIGSFGVSRGGLGSSSFQSKSVVQVTQEPTPVVEAAAPPAEEPSKKKKKKKKRKEVEAVEPSSPKAKKQKTDLDANGAEGSKKKKSKKKSKKKEVAAVEEKKEKKEKKKKSKKNKAVEVVPPSKEEKKSKKKKSKKSKKSA